MPPAVFTVSDFGSRARRFVETASETSTIVVLGIRHGEQHTLIGCALKSVDGIAVEQLLPNGIEVVGVVINVGAGAKDQAYSLQIELSPEGEVTAASLVDAETGRWDQIQVLCLSVALQWTRVGKIVKWALAEICLRVHTHISQLPLYSLPGLHSRFCVCSHSHSHFFAFAFVAHQTKKIFATNTQLNDIFCLSRQALAHR